MPTIAEVRAQYPQYKDMSDADLAGALHSKFYSDMPRADFDKKVGLVKADPYRETAEKEFAEMKAKGVPVEQGATRQFLQGMTFNAADDVLAGLSTPFEMVKRGTFSPVEGYRHAVRLAGLV